MFSSIICLKAQIEDYDSSIIFFNLFKSVVIMTLNNIMIRFEVVLKNFYW